MAITLSSTSPLNNATQVTRNTATSGPYAITFTLSSSSPSIVSSSLNVKVNGKSVIVNGTVALSDFSVVITPAFSTTSVSLIFLDSAQKFDSFETVLVSISATDTSSTFTGGFSFRIEDVISPVIQEVAPISGSVDNRLDTSMFFRITDVGSGADPSSLNVTLTLDQNAIMTGENAILLGVFQSGYSGSITSAGSALDVFFTRTTPFLSSASVTVNIHAQDEQNNVDGYFEFGVLDITPPSIANFIPAPNSTNVAENTTISLTITDLFGLGVNLSSLNIDVNGIPAILNGTPQPLFSGSSILYSPSLVDIQTLTVVILPSNNLPSAFYTLVNVNVKDNRGNQASSNYSFLVRDYLPPQVTETFPADGYVDILPDTSIRFTLTEDLDGYGVDFSTLVIEIDGYSILNQTLLGIPVDGYEDVYGNRVFDMPPITNVDGYYLTPTVADAYTVFYPGFSTTINQPLINQYDFIISPLTPFDFDVDVSTRIVVTDRGGNSDNILYFFHTATEDHITTTASPSTGTFRNFIDGYGLKEAYKFLYETGVVFTTNLPNTTTYYTTDGSVPRIDQFNRVVGSTQVFTKPVLINKQGINVLKYFSADEAGNRESVKQEVYALDILPPEIKEIRSVAIYADIPFPTTIIPLQAVDLFRAGELVRVLDDARPPILTKILSINFSSNPQFIIVEDSVEKLKVSRNARVELAAQPLDPAAPIDFDATQLAESLYIGSDGRGNNQADSVLESFRILNIASTDEEILADFTLLAKGATFVNQDQAAILSSNFSTLEKKRINMPNNTLVLLNFDGSVLNTPQHGVLANNSTAIVDVNAAGNDVIFTIRYKAGQFLDRQLLTTVLTNFAPVDLNVIVKFEEIG